MHAMMRDFGGFAEGAKNSWIFLSHDKFGGDVAERITGGSIV
jgi:hypothetical protein